MTFFNSETSFRIIYQPYFVDFIVAVLGKIDHIQNLGSNT